MAEVQNPPVRTVVGHCLASREPWGIGPLLGRVEAGKWGHRSRVVNGAITPTGGVSYGLKPGQAAALRPILQAASVGTRGRNGLIPVVPVVLMTVESHGRTTGWLRDPVITDIHVEPSGM